MNGVGPYDPLSRLSEAERKVVELLCEGLTNPEIGDRMCLSPRTVQSHLYSVFKKLDVKTRTQLVALVVGSRSRLDG